MNGYDKVEFGVSIDEVKSIYPDIEDTTSEDERKDGVLRYGKTYNEGIMTCRYFYFYNNKLCQVKVIFENIDQTTENLLFIKFTKKYGKPNNTQKFKTPLNRDTYKEISQLAR